MIKKLDKNEKTNRNEPGRGQAYFADAIEVIKPNSLPATIPLNTYADFDDSDPNSLVNLLPVSLLTLLQELPVSWFNIPEEDLPKACFVTGEADPTSERLRISFWEEYDNCQKARVRNPTAKMSVQKIVNGICSELFFTSSFTMSQPKFAWMLHPPINYLIELKDIHQLSLRSMRKVVNLPVVDPNTQQPNIKLIEVQNKIFQHIDQRLKGAIIQRIDQRNLNLNVDAPASEQNQQKANELAKMSMQEIQQKLNYLEAESKSLEAPQNIKVDLMSAIIGHTPENSEAILKTVCLTQDSGTE